MHKIITLEGSHLEGFLDFADALLQHRHRVRQVRVCIDGDTLKLKPNEQTWTPGYGHLDPTCEVAREPRLDTPEGPRGVGCFPPVP